MVKAIHRALVKMMSQRPSRPGTFKNSIDQLHKIIVTKQLSIISRVPRLFGWGTQPRAKLLEFAVDVDLYCTSDWVGAIQILEVGSRITT